MPRIPINRERYQAFLNAFLTLGPKFAAVARQVGCDDATAKKAWERGWPEAEYAPPISVIYAESVKKRGLTLSASLVPQCDDFSAAATPKGSGAGPDSAGQFDAATLQKYAIEALQEEMQMLRTLRHTGVGLANASNRILDGFAAISKSVGENMLIAAQNVSTCTPESLLNPLERFARCVDLLAVTQERLMKMQRLLVGAPQQIIEGRTTSDGSAGADTGGAGERLARLTALMASAGLLTPAQDTSGPENKQTGYQGEESSADHSHDVTVSQQPVGTEGRQDAQGKPWPKPDAVQG